MEQSKFTDEHIGYIVVALVLAAVTGAAAWYLGAFDSLLGEQKSGRDSLIKPITFDATQFDMDKVLLGRRLYHDGILSGDGSVSCASCHAIAEGGAEARRVSIGVGGAPGPINAPTVLNSGFNFVQFWDGRSKNLLEQAGGPMTNPIEMHSNFTIITERLERDSYYAQRFSSVFPDRGISEETITEAVAHYEDSLQTPAPFDAWLKGDDTAVDEQVLRGHKTFQEVGCTTCHNGINVGGNSYQKMGLVKDYFAERGGEIIEADLGRYNVTKEDSDKHKFKVPTLRNITLTAPYFHDGSTWELDEAVRTMARVQLGRELTDDQVSDIIAFLESLEGELPEHAIMPESELPPERPYELVPDYDVRFVYLGQDADPQLRVLGTVRNEDDKAALEAAVRQEFRRIDVARLAIDEAATPVSVSAHACATAAAQMLNKLDRGRFDIAFADDASKIRLAGEGQSEPLGEVTTAFSTLPEGCAAWEELTVYESHIVEQCDERLAAIQGETTLAFRKGSAELTAAAQGQLRDVSKALEGCPESIRLRIDGHTDDSGNADANMRLSRARAFAVRDLLMRLGIDPGRMVARGFGSSRPLSDDAADNRRIELRLDRPGVAIWAAKTSSAEAAANGASTRFETQPNEADSSSRTRDLPPPKPAGDAGAKALRRGPDKTREPMRDSATGRPVSATPGADASSPDEDRSPTPTE